MHANLPPTLLDGYVPPKTKLNVGIIGDSLIPAQNIPQRSFPAINFDIINSPKPSALRV